MSSEWVLVPLAAFALVAIAIVMGTRYRTERLRVQGGGDYQRLADEAVRGQRVLLEEVQRMNATLKEIERLLREV